MTERTPIIIPCEVWAREFDAKLLLSCCLAERGHTVYLGCKNTINMDITSYPRGLYLAKDFRVSSDTMFAILKQLGYTIMAWDEEATLPFDVDEYHTVRVSPPSFEKVSAFFAWGTENQHAIETAPSRDSAPVHLTGNPRGDLMRPELHAYFQKEVEALKKEYGEIVLINSNFGRMNHFLELERIAPGERDPSYRGRPSSPRYVRRGHHKAELFQYFLKLVPLLASSFPGKTIVIRPHPSESFEAWRQAAQGHENVVVVHKGHVHPWLHASDVMIHSSCTTGMEGYLLNRPVLGYQPIESEESVEDLPNKLSHNVHSADELLELVEEYSRGKRHVSRRPELDKLVDPIVTSMDGPLASDRIADRIDEHWRNGQLDSHSGPGEKMLGTVKAKLRALKKQIDYRNPNHKSNREYDRHRFPAMELSDVRDHVMRYKEILNRFTDIDASAIGSSKRIFKIAPGK